VADERLTAVPGGEIMDFFAGLRLALLLSVVLWGAIGSGAYVLMRSEPHRILLTLR
jgi:hypothetical protein